VLKLELSRVVESGAPKGPLFDRFFSISSNNKAFAKKSAFDVALDTQCKLMDLRGLFSCLT
jgi:hypothetical protein